MTSRKSKILEKNLYDLLETVSTATESEIKKAYRKKALKCHPDKNPDNPKAAELFHELSEALEILTDPNAREAYDRTLKAKELAKERTRVLDSKRRKLKEDLERREQAAKDAAVAARSRSTQDDIISDEEKLQKEIDRLKKEGSRALREEQELIRQQILKEQQGKVSFLQEVSKPVVTEDESSKPRFKVKWSNNLLYDYDKLMNIFAAYGSVTTLAVLKKSALVEYGSQEDADKAFQSESEKPDNNLKLEWISRVSPNPKKPTNNTDQSTPTTASFSTPRIPTVSAAPQAPPASFDDFEAMILGKLSAAAAAQANSSNGNNTT